MLRYALAYQRSLFKLRIEINAMIALAFQRFSLHAPMLRCVDFMQRSHFSASLFKLRIEINALIALAFQRFSLHALMLRCADFMQRSHFSASLFMRLRVKRSRALLEIAHFLASARSAAYAICFARASIARAKLSQFAFFFHCSLLSALY